VSDKSPRTDFVGKLSGPRAPRQADCRLRHAAPRRLPRDDPRAEVSEDVRVGVGVGPVEFSFYGT